MDPDRLEWSPFKGYSCGNTRTSGNCLEPVGDLVPAATQQQCNHLPLLQRARTNNRQGKITYSLDWQWISVFFIAILDLGDIGSISSRCLAKEPALLPRTRSKGVGNRAYLESNCNQRKQPPLIAPCRCWRFGMGSKGGPPYSRERIGLLDRIDAWCSLNRWYIARIIQIW